MTMPPIRGRSRGTRPIDARLHRWIVVMIKRIKLFRLLSVVLVGMLERPNLR